MPALIPHLLKAHARSLLLLTLILWLGISAFTGPRIQTLSGSKTAPPATFMEARRDGQVDPVRETREGDLELLHTGDEDPTVPLYHAAWSCPRLVDRHGLVTQASGACLR